MTHRFPGRDGQPLAYRELGAGRPLVLFHGFSGNSAQWLDHGPAAALAARRRVILPDLRGHGDSTAEVFPSDVLVDDGLALVDHLGLDDYDLGGYSLGARVVLRMLVRGAHPGRAIVAGQGFSGTGGGNRATLEAMVAGTADPDEAYWFARSGNDPGTLLRVLDSLVATERAALTGITTPTLVAIGDRDTGDAETLAAALPNARFTRVPGDHFTALGSAEFARAALDFLDHPDKP